MKNAGLNSEVIYNKLDDKHSSNSYGYDARNETIVNMFDAGIIDPVKVTRVALEKAASVAGTMLITECIITTIKETNKSVEHNATNWDI
jgi:chaperonin GroEL